MKLLATFLLSFLILTTACDRVIRKTNSTLNKTGETVGEGATEFFEGVTEGVDRSLQCELVLSKELQAQGISTGTFSVQDDSTGGASNILVLYLIFEKDFDSAITIRAINKKGQEIGRSKIWVSGEAGDAGYFDFTFDKRTYIEVKSKIIIE